MSAQVWDSYRPLAFFERWRGRLRQGYRCRLPEAAALVDAALLLWLFFLAGSSYVIQPGIRISLPLADFVEGASYRNSVIAVSQEGMIFFDDERVPRESLPALLADAVRANPSGGLLIEADQRVSNRTLMELFNMAVEAGITNVVVATRPLVRKQ